MELYPKVYQIQSIYGGRNLFQYLFVGNKVVKVICQTCYSEHPYLEGKEKKKPPKVPKTAFDQVLAKVAPSAAPTEEPAAKKPKAKSAARPLIRHKSKSPGKK